jgi:DNA helicase-2/ATP-dependent DNA helicase PcrA
MGEPAKDLQFEWLAELNPEQRRAVVHGDGPLLVIAGAGSGKTRTLAYRVAYLIAAGTPPEKILLLTFTRRAAEEMLKRADEIMRRGGVGSAGKVWSGTFHAVANRLLRMYARTASLDPEFTVMDQSDAEDVLNVIRHEMGLHGREKRFPRKATCLAIYSRCVNGGEDLDHVLRHSFPWCAEWKAELKDLFKRYVARKQEQNVLDYDDLLLYWAQLVSDDGVSRQMSERFAHVLVDEYQDTNTVQAEILAGMRRFNRNLMVVGDDAQSIYRFRSATIRNILDFPKQFEGAAVVTLEQNYRSVTPILEATNRLIAASPQRYQKQLWSDRRSAQQPMLVTSRDEDSQNEYVIRRVLEHYEAGIPLRRQAVLFRIGHLSDSLEVELSRRHIPFHKYGGLRFLEAAHVKDMVSFLRILENPRDQVAWFRVLQLLDGVGPGTAARAFQHVAAAGYDPGALASFAPPPAARAGLDALLAMIGDVRRIEPGTPAPQVERVRRFYDPILAKRYEHASVREQDLLHLEQIAANYKSRGRFLTDLQLDPPTSTSDLAGPPVKDEDWLVLSTIHSAKGCEWDVVFLIHAADGMLPADMATGNPEEIEEERRLAYVAMTRARDFLYVTWPMRYYHKTRPYTDRHTYAQLSRFITPDVQEVMSKEVVGIEEKADETSGPSGGKLDIRARIRSRWED